MAEARRAVPAGRWWEEKTTIMLGNLPKAMSFTAGKFLRLLEDKGFNGKFDFFYMPIDFQTYRHMGYAFVNFRDEEGADQFSTFFENFSEWPPDFGVAYRKPCRTGYAPVQGREANVRRFQNYAVPGKEMEEDFKPMLFDESGKRIPFEALEDGSDGIPEEFCCRKCLESCALADVREFNAHSYCVLCQDVREPTRRPTCGHNMCQGCYETCIVAHGVVHPPKVVGIRVAILGPQNSGKTTLFSNLGGQPPRPGSTAEPSVANGGHVDGKPLTLVDTVGVGRVTAMLYERMWAETMQHPDIRGEVDAIIITVSLTDCNFGLDLKVLARRLRDWFPNLDERQVIVVGTKPDRAEEADREKLHNVAGQILGMTPGHLNVIVVHRDDVQPLVEAIKALPRAPLRFERNWVRGAIDLSYRGAVFD